MEDFLMYTFQTIGYGLFYAASLSNYLRYASSFSIPMAWALTGFIMTTACVIPVSDLVKCYSFV